MRVCTFRQIWTLQVKYIMTPTFSSLGVFGTEASLLQGQKAQTRAPFHFLQLFSRQCIGTVDTRLYSAECEDPVVRITGQ